VEILAPGLLPAKRTPYCAAPARGPRGEWEWLMPTLSFKGKTAVETYHYTVPHHVLEFDEKLSVLPKG
jgi:hypothetical protein